MAVKRLPAIEPENLRKEFRLDASQQYIAVGDGERTALAVAGGSGIGAC